MFWVFFQTFPKFSLSPVPDFVLNQKRSGEERKIAVYQIGNHLSPSSLNLKAVYEEKLTFSNSSLPPVYANRFVTGINKLKFKSTSKIEYLKGGSLYCKYMNHFYYTFKQNTIHNLALYAGYGLERGGVTCMIYNTMSSNTTVIFMETVPWFLRVYFSSLRIENDGKEIKPCKYSNGSDG